jgi:hypothetical protein
MEHWISFIYLYGIGGIIFCIPIFLGIKKGVLKLNRKTDRRILYGLLSAYWGYFAFQGVWNILAIGSRP